MSEKVPEISDPKDGNEMPQEVGVVESGKIPEEDVALQGLIYDAFYDEAFATKAPREVLKRALGLPDLKQEYRIAILGELALRSEHLDAVPEGVTTVENSVLKRTIATAAEKMYLKQIDRRQVEEITSADKLTFSKGNMKQFAEIFEDEAFWEKYNKLHAMLSTVQAEKK